MWYLNLTKFLDPTEYRKYISNLSEIKEHFEITEKPEDKSDQYEEVEVVDFDNTKHLRSLINNNPWDEDDDGPKNGVRCQNT